MKSIEEYLDALKTEMNQADPALLQDALADAREHLTLALEEARELNPAGTAEELLPSIIEKYGSPQETAASYKEVERRTPLFQKQTTKSESWLVRFFGIYGDARSWGALLFLLITLVTGIVYFTWAVTGISLSAGLLVLIIGLPFTILFLASVQGLALLEGRLVESLLGVRMPRRVAFAQPGLKWSDRLWALLKDRHTWLSLVYFVLQMPLGVIYFTVFTVLLVVSLAFIAVPFLSFFVPISYYHSSIQPVWLVEAALFVGGILGLTTTMHLARGLGYLHGKYAKWMLVSG